MFCPSKHSRHGINDDSGEFIFLPSDAVMPKDGAIKDKGNLMAGDKGDLDIPAKLIFADTIIQGRREPAKNKSVDNDKVC